MAMGIGSCVPRVPWYVFCSLEYKNIAIIGDFSRWVILLIEEEKPRQFSEGPPLLLIIDQQIP